MNIKNLKIKSTQKILVPGKDSIDLFTGAPGPKEKKVLQKEASEKKEIQKEAQSYLNERDPIKASPIKNTQDFWPSFVIENATMIKKSIARGWCLFRYQLGTNEEGGEVFATQIMSDNVQDEDAITLAVGGVYNIAGKMSSRRYLDKETNLWIEKSIWVLLDVEAVEDLIDTNK